MNEPAIKQLQLADGRNLSYSDTGTGDELEDPEHQSGASQ
jgi:hypothetical protein